MAAVTLVTRHWAAGQNLLLGLLTAAAAHGRYSVRHLGHRYLPCFVGGRYNVDGDSGALPPESPVGVLCCLCD